VKITEQGLSNLVPNAGSGQPIPPIFNTINEIIKGVNEMLSGYRELTGKPVIHTAATTTEKTAQNWAEARANQKTLAANKVVVKNEVIMSDDFGDLLTGFINSLTKAEALGLGGATLAEALSALPFTVTQAKEFLIKVDTERKAKNA
tara:strand:- start:40 stop:480 length:441 start_codon:yes stop_codon:yes gene_type:complete